LKTFWLPEHFNPTFEDRVPGGRRRLDAGLWSQNRLEYVIEWEWDQNKVHRDFPYNDLAKVVADVPGQCGVAIVQTRRDGKCDRKADETLSRIRASYVAMHRDERPVGLIDICRMRDDITGVEFQCSFYQLGEKMMLPALSFGFATEGC
jgi:hypothetical protein